MAVDGFDCIEGDSCCLYVCVPESTCDASKCTSAAAGCWTTGPGIESATCAAGYTQWGWTGEPAQADGSWEYMCCSWDGILHSQLGADDSKCTSPDGSGGFNCWAGALLQPFTCAAGYTAAVQLETHEDDLGQIWRKYTCLPPSSCDASKCTSPGEGGVGYNCWAHEDPAIEEATCAAGYMVAGGTSGSNPPYWEYLCCTEPGDSSLSFCPSLSLFSLFFPPSLALVCLAHSFQTWKFHRVLLALLLPFCARACYRPVPVTPAMCAMECANRVTNLT